MRAAKLTPATRLVDFQPDMNLDVLNTQTTFGYDRKLYSVDRDDCCSSSKWTCPVVQLDMAIANDVVCVDDDEAGRISPAFECDFEYDAAASFIEDNSHHVDCIDRADDINNANMIDWRYFPNDT